MGLILGLCIPTIIQVLKKEYANVQKGIFMIDASKGFIKDGNKNRLRAQDIHKIVDSFNRGVEIPRYSRMVSLAEISDPKNGFNLNLPCYIHSAEPEDIQDLDAHLWGDIPDVRTALFTAADRPGYCELKHPIADVKRVILDNPKFIEFRETVDARFIQLEGACLPHLNRFDVKGHQKALIEALCSGLSGMDAEIKALEQRCEKTRAIKLGMMQELLTGRTRLV